MTIYRRHPSWIVFTAALALAASWANHGRADVPIDRYEINKDEYAVYDTKTLLTWQSTFSTRNTWAGAQDYCTKLNLNGIMGWRVPSMKELQTIVDEKEQNPSIELKAFPNTPPGDFWTSSHWARSSTKTWTVRFSAGNTHYYDEVASVSQIYVRCVR